MGEYEARQVLRQFPMYIPTMNYKLFVGLKVFMKNSISFKTLKANFYHLEMISRTVLLQSSA